MAAMTFPSTKPGLQTGYKASIAILLLMFLTGFLWTCHGLLLKWKALGPLHRAYAINSPQNQRNTVVYVMHLIFDTVLLGLWLGPFIQAWCGCGEISSSVYLLQVGGLYIIIAYGVEMVWRYRVDTMLAVHHVVTILIISVLLGELAWDLYQVGDAVLLLAFFAILEQPTFVALLLKRMMRPGSRHVLRAWHAAVWFWFGSKLASVGLAIYLIVRDWELMPTYAKGVYIGCWALIAGVQGWSGLIQLSILRSVQKEVASVGGRVKNDPGFPSIISGADSFKKPQELVIAQGKQVEGDTGAAKVCDGSDRSSAADCIAAFE